MSIEQEFNKALEFFTYPIYSIFNTIFGQNQGYQNKSLWPAPPVVLPVAPIYFIFSAQHSRASYDNIMQSYNTLEVLNAELQMLLDTNPSTIRIDIGFDAFAQNNITIISTLDSLITSIKNAGKKLCIADASEEYFRSNPQTWSVFQTYWINRVNVLSARYMPDYYVTIKEPGWYEPMISDPTSITAVSMLSLQQQLYQTVKMNAPNCLVGMAMEGGGGILQSDSVLQGISIGQMTSLYCDFAGFDIYSYNDFTQMQQFIQLYPTTKPIWFPEFWPQYTEISSPIQDPLDIQSFYSLSVDINASMISPFFTDDFVDYNMQNITDSTTLISNYQTLRNPTFMSYQQVTRL